MAAKCRKVGNAFEYMVCRALDSLGVTPGDEFTVLKLKRLHKDYTILNESKRTTHAKHAQLCKALRSLKTTFAPNTTYHLQSDGQGARGCSADLIITSDPPIRLSIKHNNKYIKHQRCNKLYLQLSLDEADTRKFRSQYSLINNVYYMKWKNTKFSNISIEEKFELYREINDLTVKWLKKDHTKLLNYIAFILDAKKESVILHWDPNKGVADVLQHDIVLKEHDSSIEVWTKNSFVYIQIDRKTLIKMRLHNGSSRITPTLSLKYETTIEGGKRV